MNAVYSRTLIRQSSNYVQPSLAGSSSQGPREREDFDVLGRSGRSARARARERARPHEIGASVLRSEPLFKIRSGRKIDIIDRAYFTQRIPVMFTLFLSLSLVLSCLPLSCIYIILYARHRPSVPRVLWKWIVVDRRIITSYDSILNVRNQRIKS